MLELSTLSEKLSPQNTKTQHLSGVYTSNLFNGFEFYLGQILSLYEAKYLGQIFSQTFCSIERQYLAQIKFQVVRVIGCVDAA